MKLDQSEKNRNPWQGTSPSIFCHFLTLVISLVIAGLLSEADVLAPGVPSLGMRNPYLSVVILTGVLVTASDAASAAGNRDMHQYAQTYKSKHASIPYVSW